MLLGRARGTSNAVSAGFATKKQDQVSWDWGLPDDVFLQVCSNDSTRFHSFRFVPWMIDFLYKSCGESDLISIGGESFRRPFCNGSLRELPFSGLCYGFSRIGSTSDSHTLIHIGSPTERVSDGATQTSGSATERLDFCRMIVCFVFKHEESFLQTIRGSDSSLNTAGIDFL